MHPKIRAYCKTIGENFQCFTRSFRLQTCYSINIASCAQFGNNLQIHYDIVFKTPKSNIKIAKTQKYTRSCRLYR